MYIKSDMYMIIYPPLSLSVYIYIYIEREREKEIGNYRLCNTMKNIIYIYHNVSVYTHTQIYAYKNI